MQMKLKKIRLRRSDTRGKISNPFRSFPQKMESRRRNCPKWQEILTQKTEIPPTTWPLPMANRQDANSANMTANWHASEKVNIIDQIGITYRFYRLLIVIYRSGVGHINQLAIGNVFRQVNIIDPITAFDQLLIIVRSRLLGKLHNRWMCSISKGLLIVF